MLRFSNKANKAHPQAVIYPTYIKFVFIDFNHNLILQWIIDLPITNHNYSHNIILQWLMVLPW